MRQINFPNWLVWIDKNLKWLSIPKLPLVLTVLQGIVFILALIKPIFLEQLALNPSAVFDGEIWRIFTFVTIPPANSFWVFLIIWFFYDVMIWLEEMFGATLLTVYFFFAWFSTVVASLLLGITVPTFMYMECSFFFALATLNPNKELHVFFILPIAFKWIAAFIATVLLIMPLFINDFSQWLSVILIFANYLIFFGKDYWLIFKKRWDKRKQKS